MSQFQPTDFVPWTEEDQSDPIPQRPHVRMGAVVIIALLAMIVSASIVLNETVFQVRGESVVINGVPAEKKNEVLASAGLEQPINYFKVSERAIAAGIRANRYLEFLDVEKQPPNRVEIWVRERKARALIQVMATNYLMDEKGMVLERLGNELGNGEMITVNGLQPQEARVGQTIVVNSGDRLNAYVQLLE